MSNIRNTEEMYVPILYLKELQLTNHHSVKAILDANRNSLMLLDLKFSIGTLGIGSGAFIAALYGMNLKKFHRRNEHGFPRCHRLVCCVCRYGLWIWPHQTSQSPACDNVRRIWGKGSRLDQRRHWAASGQTRERMRHRRLKEERLGALEERKMNLLQQRQEAAIAASTALGKRMGNSVLPI